MGKYTYPNEDKMVQVIQKEEKTYWQEKNFTVEMELEEPDLYSFVNNPKLKVVFFNDKMVEFYPSGKTMTYKKRNDLPVSINDLDRLVGKYFNKELDVNIELKLDEENTLKLKFNDDDNFSDVTVYNGSFMMANNYFLKVIRDDFERASEILLTYGRALNISFHKQTNLKFQPKIKTDDGYLQVTTINSKNNDSSDILLTANHPNGNEKWFKKLGGTSYDKASSIIATDDGYLIVGSTSSFGNGNYDIFVIKIDKTGQKQWQNTYGDFYNEYGYTAEIINNGYVIKGTKQKCTSNTDINRECTSNVWFVTIDKKGEKMAEKILEEFKG